MQCYVCTSNHLFTILDKGPTKVWHGSGDRADSVLPRRRFRCRLVQCRVCGHVQQPMFHALKEFLSLLYQSPYANVSTEVGVGSWGGRRGRLIKKILSELPLSRPRSVLEIGCAGGYVLRYLQRLGFKDLVGVDPSVKKNYTERGIEYRNGFVSSNLHLSRSFDFVISLCGFEHIEDINDVFFFLRRHLREGGFLFFEVPYSLPQLTMGDPAVFLHEHIHHFTTSSLRVLLQRHGFRIAMMESIGDSFFVFAQKKKVPHETERSVILYKAYGARLDHILAHMRSVIQSTRRLAFHGACNALHNLIQWANIKSNFVLFDNDPTKTGKKYFGKEVLLPTRTRVQQHDCVIIAPSVYANEIITQYRHLGFRGKIEAITSH